VITPLRSSLLRAALGAALALLAAGVLLFALPSAAQRRTRSVQGEVAATRQLEALKAEVRGYQEQAGRLRRDREVLQGLLANMPSETVGHLQWRLSEKLFELAGKDAVRLIAIKYGAPAREGPKGSLLEALDVEFTVQGVFQDLKPFMLALEGSKLPFAVVSAKLDESPEGAHLTVVLRAFRQAPGTGSDQGEDA